MNIVGIIVEYNPFHNGHLYHLSKIKELYKDSIIIAVMSGNFNQRGEVSIISKWDKASIALEYGVDIVVELPYPFATQSADTFAKGSISILKHMGVDTIVFGSESNNIEDLTTMANIQVNDINYENKVKEYLDMGFNYPTSMAKGLMAITDIKVEKPNDILGICYIKEILKQKANINPICIKRTNDYHDLSIKNDIASASSIRIALKNKKNISKVVPKETLNHLDKLYFNDMYYSLLQYKIMTSNDLSIYHTVDEGIDYRLKKYINSKSLDEFISNIKTKRYTYNKISRMLTHILNNFTKEEALNMREIEYIRVLGFSEKGQKYLNKIKKETIIPIITNFSTIKNKMLDLEYRTTCVYASVLNEEDKIKMIESEYKNKPIKRG